MKNQKLKTYMIAAVASVGLLFSTASLAHGHHHHHDHNHYVRHSGNNVAGDVMIGAAVGLMAGALLSQHHTYYNHRRVCHHEVRYCGHHYCHTRYESYYC